MERVTIFHAKKVPNKVPISPTDDLTFVFETYEANSNLELFSVLVSNYILNVPLDIQEPIRTFRRKVDLIPYQGDLTYILLDLDNVFTEDAKNRILDYFKDYQCIIGQSRSYNGIDNFRMKGILFIETLDLDDAKLMLANFKIDLIDYCEVDESIARAVSYNAPIRKNKIFINNENSPKYKFEKKAVQEKINAIRKEYIGTGTKFNHAEIKNLENIEAETMEILCLKVFQNMGFTAIRNNANDSITFKHPNEKKSIGGYFWFSTSPYTMHHASAVKTINIFDSVRSMPQAKEIMRKDINYDDEFLEFNTDTSVISVNQKYLNVTDEIQDNISLFLSQPDGLFSIRSAMGTGKSTIINHIINECHDEDLRVLIITNRISVANDFGKKYKLKIYNKDKYERNDSLVCQYDSLWKFDITQFDVVVMDEFISLMIHSRSNLNNNSINIGKYFASFNKKLVIADAFLTGYENFLLDTKKKNMHLLNNEYRDKTTLYSYESYHYFLDNIVIHAAKHKLTVSSTSMSFINSLHMLLTERGFKVISLTAGTPDSTKNLVYDLFEKEDHDKWDVLIFSPTLTVGVSNLNNVNYHFHYDSSMSSDVISSIQMIKRTRKSKEIHLFLKDRVNYLKTSYNDIRDDYMINMGKNIDQNYLFSIDNYGESKLSEIGKKAIKIDTFKNILEFNHKEAFFWLIKYHFLNEPRLLTKQVFSGNILSKYIKRIKKNSNSVLLNNIEQFLSLNDIEKNSIMQNSDAEKVMKLLVEINDEIKECPKEIKAKILEFALKDKSFIKKCRYYRAIFNYTKKIWDKSDVSNLVSKAVIEKKNEDLNFYNSLISYGQHEIFDEYLPKIINSKKDLQRLLDATGYQITKNSTPTSVAHREYVVNKDVKEYYGWIR
jgi:hypothetical protein